MAQPQMSGNIRNRDRTNMAALNSAHGDQISDASEETRLIHTDRPSRFQVDLILKLVLSLVCGILFGIAVEKGRGK